MRADKSTVGGNCSSGSIFVWVKQVGVLEDLHRPWETRKRSSMSERDVKSAALLAQCSVWALKCSLRCVKDDVQVTCPVNET